MSDAALCGAGGGAQQHRDPAVTAADGDDLHHLVHEVFTPVVPDADTLEYRGFVLTNGMRVLLVRNPDEKEHTSASLALARGNMSDPQGCAGMAHFCEHMLFLGNEAYPVEGDYKKYLREHGGSCNASTSGDVTKYYFTVVSEFFDGAIGRFLNFFISPLFRQDSTMRELNAVDSEYRKNCLSDARREFYLLKHLSNPGHNFSNFGSGNLETLLYQPQERGIDIREELLGFYDANYSSDIMSLVVRSDLPLDVLQRTVVQGFSQVRQKGLSRAYTDLIGKKHFTAEQLGKVARYSTIGDRKEVKLVFPYTLTDGYKDRSDQVLLSLLGHEGTGSLCHALRRQGLISHIYTSELRRSQTKFGHLSISMTLTDLGRDKVFEVIGEVFKYTAMLQQHLPLVRKYWEEQRRSNQVRFNFTPRPPSTGRYVSSLSDSLNRAEFPEDAVAYGQLWHNFKEADIVKTLGDIRSDNMLVLLTCQAPSDYGTEKRTPYFNVDYSLRDFTEGESASMGNGVPGLSPEVYTTPADNPFIPENFEVLQCPEVAPPTVPTIAHQTDYVKVWWKQDVKFLTPKMHASVYLVSPAVNFSCKNQVLTQALSEILDMRLQASYYDADVCAPWSISSNLKRSAILLMLKGFSDKLPLLLSSIVRDIINFDIHERDFEMVKEDMMRAVQNEKVKNSTILANHRIHESLIEGVSPPSFTETAVSAMEYEDLLEFVKKFKSDIAADLFVHGNVTDAGAIAIGTALDEVFITDKLCRRMRERPRSRRVVCFPMTPQGTPPIEYIVANHTPNESNLDSAVVVRYQIGVESFRQRAELSVLAQLISPRFFTELRTKQQLGYGVSSGIGSEYNELSFHFSVRSGVVPPSEVHSRIDTFLANFGNELEMMAEADVEASIEAARQKFSTPHANLSQEHARLLTEILNGTRCWNREEKLVQELASITKADIVNFFRINFRPQSWDAAHSRRVFASYAYSDADAARELQPVLNTPTRRIDGEVDATVTFVNPANPLPWKDTMALYPCNSVPKIYGERSDCEFEYSAYNFAKSNPQ